MKIFKVLCAILVSGVLLAIIAALYVYYALPNVGAAPVLQVQKTTSRIERGKYLANHVAVCMDCHSQRDWALFSGPVKKGSFGAGGELFGKQAGFPGNIYSTNLTPRTLGSWTDGELYRAIACGVGKEGRALFPVMGYKRFGKMDREDIYSIIAYLRELKAFDRDVPVTTLDFPVNLLNRLSPEAASHQTAPSANDTIRYGAYLANAAGCVDCHSKQDMGQILEGTQFGGGMEFRQAGGIIRSANITGDKTTGIGTWTEQLFLDRFQQYQDTSYAAAAIGVGQLNTPMPWTMYAGMKKEDLAAIYHYLKSLKPIRNHVKIRSYEK